MRHTARSGAGHRHVPTREKARPRRRGLALAAGRAAAGQGVAPTDPTWWGAVRPVARVAVWALPGYALVHLWWGVTAPPDPVTEPAAWAEQVAGVGYLVTQVLAGLGGVLLGLIAMVAVVALLLALPGRWLAVTALVTALAAAVLLLPRFAVTIGSARAVIASGPEDPTGAAQLYLDMQAAAAPILSCGMILVTAAWSLLGLAVWRSGAFNRGDGVLLVVAGLLIGAGGLLAPVLVPLGALLLLAAGLGIGWTVGRLTRAGSVPGEPTRAEPVPGERVRE